MRFWLDWFFTWVMWPAWFAFALYFLVGRHHWPFPVAALCCAMTFAVVQHLGFWIDRQRARRWEEQEPDEDD